MADRLIPASELLQWYATQTALVEHSQEELRGRLAGSPDDPSASEFLAGRVSEGERILRDFGRFLADQSQVAVQADTTPTVVAE